MYSLQSEAFEMVGIKYFNQKNYALVAAMDIYSKIMVFYAHENASKSFNWSEMLRIRLSVQEKAEKIVVDFGQWHLFSILTVSWKPEVPQQSEKKTTV